jgi:hypothetical protein
MDRLQFYQIIMLFLVMPLTVTARELRELSYEKIYRAYKQEKAWGVEAQIDLDNCDQYTIRSRDSILEFAKKLCTMMNIVRIHDAQLYHVGGSDEKTTGYCMTQVTDSAQITARFINSSNKVLLRILSNEPFDAQKIITLSKMHFKASDCKTKISLQ